MKVRLIKEAEYDLNNDKCTKIPFNVFCKMSGVDMGLCKDDNYQSVRIFTDIDEFKKAENFTLYDESKDVYVLPNGQFCIFLKEKEEKLPTLTNDKQNEPTDTKENTSKKS